MEDQRRKKEEELAELERKSEAVRQELDIADETRPPSATRKEIEEAEEEARLRTPANPNKGLPFGLGTPGIGQTILVSLVVTFLVVSVLLPMFGGGGYVLKKDFDTNLGNVSDTISQLTLNMEKTNTDLATTLQGVPATVNAAMAQTTALVNNLSQKVTAMEGTVGSYNANIQNNASQLAALTQSLNNLSTTVGPDSQKLAELTNLVQAYTAEVKRHNILVLELQEKVDEFEAMQGATEQPSSVVTAKVKTISNNMVATTNTTMSGSIRIELRNSTNVAIKDIVLGVSILTDNIAGYSSSSLTGAATIWQGQGIPWNMMEFMNTQWGLNLGANETRVLYLTYTVTGTGFWPQYQTYGVPFQVDVEVF